MTSKRMLLLGLVLSTSLTTEPASADKKQQFVVIVHKLNPATSLSRAELKNLFLKLRQRWPNGKRVVALNARASSKLRRAFDRQLLGMAPRDVGAYWVKQRVAGRTTPPRQIPSTALTKRLVKALPGAVAYIERSVVDPSVKVVAIDGVKPGDPRYRFAF